MNNLKRRALVVEDEFEAYEGAIRRLLPHDAEWELTVARRVDEAVAIFEHDRNFDLLVVDFFLPDENSTVFLERVREWDENVPLLLFSQHSSGGFSLTDPRSFRALHPFVNKRDLENDEAVSAYERDIRAAYNGYMAERCDPQIYDEYGHLESVLVHSPSDELECLDPDELPPYLFESIPRVFKAREEHAAFVQELKRAARGPIVLELARLLYEVVRNASAGERREIAENILLPADLRAARRQFAEHLGDLTPRLGALLDEVCDGPPQALVRQLLRGINIADFLPGLDEARRSQMWSQRRYQVVKPASNLYFTRDPAFVLGSGVVLSKMHWPVRRREPTILREVFMRHPFMARLRRSLLDLDAEPMTFSIEGGDAMAIAKGVYAIAESERTNRQAVRKTVEFLVAECGAERVYQPSIPVKRAFIHLDTVCSVAGERHVVVHPEAMDAQAEVRVWTEQTLARAEEPQRAGLSFLDLLGRERIPTAQGGPQARHEQFDDASNVFMATPTTAIAYDRNPATNEALRQCGIKVATFMGDDLVLGRGGPRCMTMPLRRRY